MKSGMTSESVRMCRQSVRMLAGGCKAISRHSAARSTSSTTSRISVVSRTAPPMRDFSTNFVTSSRPEKSKRPPARRNSRTSPVNSCCSLIQAESSDGARDSILAWPRGEEAYAPQQFAKRVELQYTRGVMDQRLRHCILCYRISEASAWSESGRLQRQPPGLSGLHARFCGDRRTSRNKAPPSVLFWQVISPRCSCTTP